MANFIEQKKEELGLTTYAFSKLTGVNNTTIKRLLKSLTTNKTIELYAQIADGLGYDFDINKAFIKRD